MILVFIIVSLLLLANGTSALFEGEACVLSPRQEIRGRCTQIHNCEYAKKLLQEKKNPQTCGFIRSTPLVCCPVQQQFNNKKHGDISQENCNRYHDTRAQVFGIDNGQEALSKEFPHMAAVGYGENLTNILWLCGGSLISHHFVLSAAHCVYSQNYGPATWIRLGDLDLKNTTEDANPQDIRIAQVFVHPEYKNPSHYNDIALFKIEKRTDFGLYFKPACLQVEKSLPVNILEATGWGKVGYFGDSSSHLMKAKLSLIDHGTCAKRYADVAKTRRLKNGILDESQICAGDVHGKDTCPGDSGGPLHYTKDGTEEVVYHFVVAGVTSFGKGCGGENSTGVYTRVSSYVGWIENIVWKNYD